MPSAVYNLIVVLTNNVSNVSVTGSQRSRQAAKQAATTPLTTAAVIVRRVKCEVRTRDGN